LKHNRAVSFLSVTNCLRFGRFTEVKVSCCEVEKGI
jgi:hypothetical protein